MSIAIEGIVPYEIGDHCIFYAVQDANIHFNQKPLTVDDRKKFQMERDERPRIHKAITGIAEEENLTWLKLTLQMLFTKLEEHNIVPDFVLCSKETEEMIKDINFIKRQNIQIRSVEGSVDIEFPVVLLVQRDAQSHVWFAESENDFDTKRDIHMKKGDKFVLAAHLIKQ